MNRKVISILLAVVFISSLSSCGISYHSIINNASADLNRVMGFYQRMNGQEGIDVFPFTNTYNYDMQSSYVKKGIVGTWLGKNDLQSNVATLYMSLLPFGGDKWTTISGDEKTLSTIADNVKFATTTSDYDKDLLYIVYSRYFTNYSRIYLVRFSSGSSDISYQLQNLAVLPSAGTYNDLPNIAIDSTGNPYVCWTVNVGTATKVVVSKWNQQLGAWTNLSNNPTPGYEFIQVPPPYGGAASYPRMAIDNNNSVYVCWSDFGLGSADCFVAKRNQNGWTNLNNSPISPIANISGNCVLQKITLDETTYQPCVIFVENNTNVHFAKWYGNVWMGINYSPIQTPLVINRPPPKPQPPDPPQPWPPDPWPPQPPPVLPPPVIPWPQPFPISLGIGVDQNKTIACIGYSDDTLINYYDNTNQGEPFMPNNDENNWGTPNYSQGLDNSNSGFCQGVKLCVAPDDGDLVNAVCKCITLNGKGYTKLNVASCKIDTESENLSLTLGPSESKDVKLSITGLATCPEETVQLSVDTTSYQLSSEFSREYGVINSGQGFESTLTISTGSSTHNEETTVSVLAKDAQNNIVGKLIIQISISVFTCNSSNGLTFDIMPPKDFITSVSFSYDKDYSTPITASVTSTLPTGLTVTFDPNPMTPHYAPESTETQEQSTEEGEDDHGVGYASDTIRINFSSTMALVSGEHIVEITFSSGQSIRVLKFIINVHDFDMVCYDDSKYSPLGEQTVSFEIDIVPRNGFIGNCIPSIDGLDERVGAYFSVNPIVLNGSLVTITCTLSFSTSNVSDTFFLQFKVTSENGKRSIPLIIRKGSFKVTSYHLTGIFVPGDTIGWSFLIENMADQDLSMSYTISGVPAYCTSEMDIDGPFTVNKNDTKTLMFELTIPKNVTFVNTEILITFTDGTVYQIVKLPIKLASVQIEVFYADPLDIKPGNSIFASIAVTSLNGYDGPVELRVMVKPSVWWIRVHLSPITVFCRSGSTVFAGATITVDGGAPNPRPDVDIGFTAFIEKTGSPIPIPVFSRIDSYTVMSVHTTAPNQSIKIKGPTTNSQAAISDLVFDVQPHKIIRQIKHQIGRDPIACYSTFIPFIAINVKQPEYTVELEDIKVLFPLSIGKCFSDDYGYKDYDNMDVSDTKNVSVILPTVYNSAYYCEPNSQARVLVDEAVEAKFSIGMPSPSTIDSQTIASTWSKVYSSEDCGPGNNNNVCIADIRALSMGIDYNSVDLESLPTLEPPLEISVPIRARFKITDQQGKVTTEEITKFADITFERPLPTHSRGAERITPMYYVGDNHIHTANSKLRVSAPNKDQQQCPNDCGCASEDPNEGVINMPGGPSVTQRSEESREHNFDFAYLADHSTGDFGYDTVDDAWHNTITPFGGCPGKPCGECQGKRCNAEWAEEFLSAFGKDTIAIGKAGGFTNSEDVAFRSYESSSCEAKKCTGRLVCNYRGIWIPNFSYNKLNLIAYSNPNLSLVDSKYMSAIISQGYEDVCGIFIPRDDWYPQSKVPKNDSYPGVAGFPWQYPACVNDCDPWGNWPASAPPGITPPFGMRHKVTTNEYGYDGFETIYQNSGMGNPSRKSQERWCIEIGKEMANVVAKSPIVATLPWDNDGPIPDAFFPERDIWHPFGVSASNVLRWWMEPWSRNYGFNTTYINARWFSRWKNDTKESETLDLKHPLGYYLRTGKTIASGKGSYATIWIGSKVTTKEDPCYGLSSPIACGDYIKAFQPGDMICAKSDSVPAG